MIKSKGYITIRRRTAFPARGAYIIAEASDALYDPETHTYYCIVGMTGYVVHEENFFHTFEDALKVVRARVAEEE